MSSIRVTSMRIVAREKTKRDVRRADTHTHAFSRVCVCVSTTMTIIRSNVCITSEHVRRGFNYHTCIIHLHTRIVRSSTVFRHRIPTTRVAFHFFISPLPSRLPPARRFPAHGHVTYSVLLNFYRTSIRRVRTRKPARTIIVININR